MSAASVATEEPKAKMFEAPKGPQRSKIWEALNPQKLFYESRREKEEQEEEKIVVNMRGGMLGSSVKGGGIDFSYARDDEGNVLIEEEGNQEELDDDNYDPNNLPDFGELQGVINEKRAEREAQAEKRRAALRAEYEAKKAREKAALDAEIALIRARDAKLKASLEVGTDVLRDSRARLTEITFDFTFDTGNDGYGFE